ncbi:hypothetical protein ACFW04_005302 [Cataglyphis niger]
MIWRTKKKREFVDVDHRVTVYGSAMMGLGKPERPLMTHENICGDAGIIRKHGHIDRINFLGHERLDRATAWAKLDKDDFRFSMTSLLCHYYVSVRSRMQREAGKPRWSAVIDLLLESDHFDVTR